MFSNNINEKYQNHVKWIETSSSSYGEGCTPFNCWFVDQKHFTQPSCLVAKWNSYWNYHCHRCHSLEKRRQFMKFRDVCIFDMRKSNVDFDTRVGESLYSNKTKLMFDGLDAKFIPVGEETKDLICIVPKKDFQPKHYQNNYQQRLYIHLDIFSLLAYTIYYGA